MPTVTVNSFLEDTCVLVAAAFLFVRGPLERLLSKPVWSGLVFGLLGASEAVFPNARFPYASHTLACAFATAFIDWRAGVVAAFVAWIASIMLRSPQISLITGIQVAITILIIALFPKPVKYRAVFMVFLVALAQALAVVAIRPIPSLQESLTSSWTILSNTFGVVLLVLVVRDARIRSEAEHHRQEVVEARRLASEAQLASLRARVKPHFLYNTLNSISALCGIAPDRASRAATKLGELMRQSLEADFSTSHSLGEELETVRSYADIEQERFGSKIRIEYCVRGCEDLKVPPFCVQILVENSILHGVSRVSGGGLVSVLARRNKSHAVVAVVDDGIGLPPEGWRRNSPQGLGILEGQIHAQTGHCGRLRLARRPNGGTLAVMRLPLTQDGQK